MFMLVILQFNISIVYLYNYFSINSIGINFTYMVYVILYY